MTVTFEQKRRQRFRKSSSLMKSAGCSKLELLVLGLTLTTLCLLLTSCANRSECGAAELRPQSLDSQFNASAWLKRSEDLDSKELQLFDGAGKLFQTKNTTQNKELNK